MSNNKSEIFRRFGVILTSMILSKMDSKVEKEDSQIRLESYEIKGIMKSLKEQLSEIDFLSLTKDELIEIGFSLWDDDGNVLLAPTWAYKFFKNGMILRSISGEEVTFGKDYIDMDTRFGVTAYGIRTEDLRDNKIESITDNYSHSTLE